MQSAAPVSRELVLLGGGHAHLGVLRDLAARGVPSGLRVTLVAREAEALYSGMLPGLVAGRFTPEEGTIDLARLARAAGARFIQAEAIGLDRGTRHILCAGGRPPLHYDLLSINVGSAPALVPGAAEHGIPLRPLDRFLARWTALRARTASRSGRSTASSRAGRRCARGSHRTRGWWWPAPGRRGWRSPSRCARHSARRPA